MDECIGIIAGGGQFPLMIACEARKKGYKIAACGFYGHTDPTVLKDSVDFFQMMSLGQVNKMFRFFRDAGAVKLCLAGAISKPSALKVRPDLRVIRILLTMREKGDDALLRALIRELEQEGFIMVSGAEFVSSLYCPAGVLSQVEPNKEIWSEIAYGWPIAKNLGSLDIGQCIVVNQKMVMAVECLEGTDATLQRAAELGGKGCVAIKIVKPKQDERVDLPAIGLETIKLLVKYKFRCIAVIANKTLFFDMSEALALANKHKLCIVALPFDDFEKVSVTYGMPS